MSYFHSTKFTKGFILLAALAEPPYFAFDWVEFLRLVRQDPASSLSDKTGLLYEDFVIFLSLSRFPTQIK
jgi:hypothetical protein